MGVSIESADFDELRDWPGFRCRRARIGRQAGAVRLGASLWEVPPGEAAYPFHYHLAEEEMVIVLSGRARLRTPSGWRELEAGEVLSFPAGEEGAHQIVNRGQAPVRFLALSTAGQPDVVVQPDSGKVGAFERLPEGGGMRLWFHQEAAVDYLEGERPPEA